MKKQKTPKDTLTKEFLIEHYVNKKKSDQAIAKELGIKSSNSIVQARKRHCVYRCNLKDSSHIITKEFLEEYYIRQNLSLKETAIRAGFKRKSIIVKALKKFRIPQREYTKSDLVIKRKPRKHHVISARYYHSLVNGAKRRRLVFKITLDQIWNLFEKQNHKCALSGILLKFNNPGERATEQTASLDRIDSNKGYTIDNVRWVHKTINNMRGELSDSTFLEFCQKIINHNKTGT